jgi:uncharacterized protein
LGPALAFLLSAPALDIVPIILTFRLFGAEFAIARLAGIILFGIIIGSTMSLFFHERQTAGSPIAAALPEAEASKAWWVQFIFFGLLVAIMVFSLDTRWLPAVILLAVFVPFFAIMFSRDDLNTWMTATYQFVRSIVPWIVIGSLGAAIIAGLLPSGFVYDLTGGGSLASSLIASIFGSLMYLCPPAEILVTKAFVQLGMGIGPALAFILTGPAVSFPSIIILVKLLGWKRSLVYIAMLIALATTTGVGYGTIFR